MPTPRTTTQQVKNSVKNWECAVKDSIWSSFHSLMMKMEILYMRTPMSMQY